MAHIILASHGELAKGMLHSATMIVGNLTEGVEVYCLYPGENPEDYACRLKSRIEKDSEQYVIIADILGGSVHTALSQLTVYENVCIFSGMNLNLVLGVLIGEQGDVSERRLCSINEEARDGITYKKCIDVKEDEDF